MVEFLQDTGRHRCKVLHPIACRGNHEHGNGQGRKVLLELKMAVLRQEHIKFGGRKLKKPSILDSRPTVTLDGGHLASDE